MTLKNENDLKYEGHIKIEDDFNNDGNLKNEDDLKYENNQIKMRPTWKIKRA